MNTHREDFELVYFYTGQSIAKTTPNDLEGTQIYSYGHYLGYIPNLVPDDIEKMSDAEFFCLLDENGIIY